MTLLAGALVQFFLAGRGVFSGAGYGDHVSFGHLLGLIAILLPVAAFMGRLERRERNLSIAVLVLYILQYAFIEIGAPVSVLHPMSGALILLAGGWLVLSGRTQQPRP